MKKKQTKSVLNIEENWSKGLTLKSVELSNVRKGGNTGSCGTQTHQETGISIVVEC